MWDYLAVSENRENEDRVQERGENACIAQGAASAQASKENEAFTVSTE